jgi:tRNA(His) guanylyltransferase
MTEHYNAQVRKQLADAQAELAVLQERAERNASRAERFRDGWSRALGREREERRGRVQAEARIAAVRALHYGESSKWGDGTLQCFICREPNYPCPTIAALDSPSAPGAAPMTDSTALGDRMKRHEAAYRAVLPRRTYTVLRVDGRAFHAYLRGAEKPFDERFAADMDAVAEALCKEISGAVLAYTQSDEISVLITDFGSANAQPWFGGVIAKQVSIAAAIATAELNSRRPGQRALFDARVFTLADPVEVANYFLWRQRDAVRNSISMAAQARISHRQLHGVSTGRMQEMLWSEHGINWNDYPDGFKRGRVTVRQVGDRAVEYVDRRSGETVQTTAVRSWWETSGARHFTVGGWLGDVIPALPGLSGTLDGPAEQPADVGGPS